MIVTAGSTLTLPKPSSSSAAVFSSRNGSVLRFLAVGEDDGGVDSLRSDLRLRAGAGLMVAALDAMPCARIMRSYLFALHIGLAQLLISCSFKA